MKPGTVGSQVTNALVYINRTTLINYFRQALTFSYTLIGFRVKPMHRVPHVKQEMTTLPDNPIKTLCSQACPGISNYVIVILYVSASQPVVHHTIIYQLLLGIMPSDRQLTYLVINHQDNAHCYTVGYYIEHRWSQYFVLSGYKRRRWDIILIGNSPYYR